MALIKCPECNREISDRATACPHCGCPTATAGPSASTTDLAASPIPAQQSHLRVEQQPEKRRPYFLAAMLCGASAVICGAIAPWSIALLSSSEERSNGGFGFMSFFMAAFILACSCAVCLLIGLVNKFRWRTSGTKKRHPQLLRITIMLWGIALALVVVDAVGVVVVNHKTAETLPLVLLAVHRENLVTLDRIRNHNDSAVREYMQKGLSFVRRGNREWDKAIAAFSSVIERDPGFSEAYWWRAMGYLRARLPDRAAADCDRVVQLAPNDADSYRLRALVHRDTQALDGAIDDYNRAIQLDPNDAESYRWRAAILQRQGKSAEADADLATAQKLEQSQSPEATSRISPDGASVPGNLPGNGPKPKSEENGFAAPAATAPGSEDPFAAPPSSSSRYRKPSGSQLTKGGTGEANSACTKGQSCLERGDYDGAIAAFTETIRLDPQSAEAHFNRGFAYGQKSEWDEEINDCNEAIRLDPKNAVTYFNRGFAYGQKGDFDKEIADYTEAIRLNPSDSLPYYARAGRHLEAKRWTEAIADYSKVIELEPTNSKGYEGRAAAYLGTNEQAKAAQDSAKAEELRGKQP